MVFLAVVEFIFWRSGLAVGVQNNERHAKQEWSSEVVVDPLPWASRPFPWMQRALEGW